MNAYLLWKSGGTTLQSLDVLLPTGRSPDKYSKVVCGTCQQFPGNPITMIAEPIVKAI